MSFPQRPIWCAMKISNWPPKLWKQHVSRWTSTLPWHGVRGRSEAMVCCSWLHRTPYGMDTKECMHGSVFLVRHIGTYRKLVAVTIIHYCIIIHDCYIIDVIAMFGPSYCRLLPDYHQPSLHLRMISLASSEVHGDQRGKGFFPYSYPTSPFQRATHQQDLVPGAKVEPKFEGCEGYVLLPCFIGNRMDTYPNFESCANLEWIPRCSSFF